MPTYTAEITSTPSTNIDSKYNAGSVDANIYRDGVLTAMEVTLVASPDSGLLRIWGSPDNWCSRTDLLHVWAVEGADPLDPDDEDFVEAAITDARSNITEEIVAAVRAAARTHPPTRTMTRVQREYLTRVAKERWGLNDHMKGWRDEAPTRDALVALGFVQVTAYRAAHAFDEDSTTATITQEGRRALVGAAK